ncbi:MAG TPA: EAL domain-containing protein [Solimonas sp.]|nr:EAL domain-containing protein [Solimonas sp.]
MTNGSQWEDKPGRAGGADPQAVQPDGPAVRALRRSEERLERALAASGLGMWDWSVDSGAIFVDDRCLEMFGYRRAEFEPTLDHLMSLTHPDDALACADAVQAHLRGDTPYYEIDYRVRTGDGRWTWMCSRGRITERTPEGEPLRVSGTVKNIDATKRVQGELERANRQIQLLLDATDEGIVGLDAAGACSFLNPAAARMLGIDAAALLGRPFYAAIRHTREHGEAVSAEESPITRCLRENQRFRSTGDVFWRDGEHSVPVEYLVSPIVDGERNAGAVLIFHDVTDKRAMAHELHRQALHDPLTGLTNRRGFEMKLEELLDSAKAGGREHALCYMDLDHFKVVNDTCGHAAGDELLRQLPKVLHPLIRAGDTLARLGGDEFGVLLTDCPLSRATRIAENMREAIGDFRFVWQYRNFTVGVSIGVAAITAASNTALGVLGAADSACYVAKEKGKNNIHVSYPHDLAVIRRRGEMRWVTRLKTALEEDQFRLHYQSIADARDPQAAPNTHELLIRLIDGKGELILPGAFIPAGERYQLMPSIDAWVVQCALRHIGEHIVPNAALAQHCFGINLSGDSLRDTRLLETIGTSLKKYGVPPSRVFFEITETHAISNLGAAVEFMRELKRLGCQLALDDFGSGMSSFSYLKHLPVDFLKIDGSFVKDILENPVDLAIVKSINSVGQEMGIRTIAEFVENQAIYDCVREIGVDYAQGYAIMQVEPLEDFVAAAQRDTRPQATRYVPGG